MFSERQWFTESVKALAVIGTMTGCQPAPSSPDMRREAVQEYITVEAKKNIYQEPSLSLNQPPQTPEAKTYTSAFFKYFTEHSDYSAVKNKTLNFDLAVVDEKGDMKIQSLSLLLAEISHLLYPDIQFMPIGTHKQKNGSFRYGLDATLADVEKLLGVADTNGIVTEDVLRALDAAWTEKEKEYLMREGQWKADCETYNLQSLIDGTKNQALVDRLIVLRNRARFATGLHMVPDHLRKYRAGQGNVFVGEERLLQNEQQMLGIDLHEHGHNIMMFGLPGRSGKIDGRFPGYAVGQKEGAGSQLPFLYAAYGGKRVPKKYVSENSIDEYEGPAGDFYGISWESAMKPRNGAVRDHVFPINVDPHQVLPYGFVSGYAATNAYEDFAETWMMAMAQPDTMKQWVAQYGGELQKKYDFITARILDKDRFEQDSGFGL